MFYKIYKDNPTPAFLTLDTTSSGTLSLFLQSLNGTNYIKAAFSHSTKFAYYLVIFLIL